MSDKLISNMFLLKPVDDIDDETHENIYHSIFMFLDQRPEQYSLISLKYNPEYEDIVRKIDGSLLLKSKELVEQSL